MLKLEAFPDLKKKKWGGGHGGPRSAEADVHCVPLCSEIQFQAHVHIMCPITDFLGKKWCWTRISRHLFWESRKGIYTFST